MPAPSLSFRRPVIPGVAGALAAVIVAFAGDAAAQPAPPPAAPPPSKGLGPASPPAKRPAPAPPPDALEAVVPAPPASAPAPAAAPPPAFAPAPPPFAPEIPAAPAYAPVAPAWGPPPGQTYWPAYAPAYPASPTFYRQEEPFSLPPPVPKQAANSKLMIAGILAATGGVATLITGSILMSVATERIDVYRDGPAYCCSIDDAPLRNAGITMLVIGGITATLGVPLWMIGGRRVPVRSSTTEKPGTAPALPRSPALRAPLLRVGATGASVSWQF